MRIAFVSRRYWPAISGMSVYAENLLRELVALGHDVTMVSQYRGDEAGTRVYGGGPPPPVDGVEVVGLQAVGEEDGGDFERDVDAMVAAVLERGPFDVVHAQYGYPTGLAALIAARELGVGCVVSIQGGDGHWVGSCCETHLRAMRLVMERASVVLIGSASFRDATCTRLGVDPDVCTIVPGGVDVARFTPGDGEGPLLYHGRVDRRKGILDLLEALPDDARLLVSGIGPDLEAARAVADPARVEFLGRVAYEDVPAVYARAGTFVSPTYAEGFSNTVLEAMAGGLPIVAGRSVGVVDALEDGRTALLVEPGDVDGLRRALRRVLDDGTLRARLRDAALREVRGRYAWPLVAGEIDAAYRRTAAGLPVEGGWEVPRERLPCRYREAPHLL